ncbi:MAG: GvpL/GvpF family gas vesicle protein [Bacteroidales bacterium]|nr:GvpL/GvpF family gas vesicle protein [Bacteroidales bacterium]MCF8345452.1 GvpL/GvpF family gas vesicle protein [Bacteroidales bacterium]MCF8350146.1 GvpL/GvpF family gas vesicle protein [Bacteroidales bacterium]
MNNDLIYVFCALETSGAADEVATGENVAAIDFDNIRVFVKYVSAGDFSEENLKKNFGDLDWVERNTREHIGIISNVMKSRTVVPFKFGTIFKTMQSLRDFIDEYRSQLIENLRELDEKEEWGVKLFCDYAALPEYVKKTCEQVIEMEREIKESKPGKAFILKRKAQELIKNECHKELQEYGQFFFRQIESLSSKTRINPLLPKEVTGRNDEMILNIACLVEKGNIKMMLKKTELLRQEFIKVGLLPDVTGPWPPFSFTTIKNDDAT